MTRAFCCDKFEEIFDEKNIDQPDKSVFKFRLAFSNCFDDEDYEFFQYCPFCGSDTKTWHKKNECNLYEIEAIETSKTEIHCVYNYVDDLMEDLQAQVKEDESKRLNNDCNKH